MFSLIQILFDILMFMLQSMMDEGLAREVVNRVQKLRKTAKLQPKDDVCVQYTLTPPDHDLGRIIKEHQEYIESTTKNVMTLDINIWPLRQSRGSKQGQYVNLPGIEY